MVVGLHRRAVGVFSHRRDAEDALHELRNSGFEMDRVSVIAQDTDRNDNIAGAEVHDRVGNKADEGASLGAVSGGTLGGLTGLLVGLGTLAIPGVGPIMLAGATATAIATTLAGAGIGAAAGSLLGGLVGLGIPEEEARGYNSRVERGHYLVIVDGTASEIATAEAIMRRRGIEDFHIYDQPGREYDTASVVPTPIVANQYDASAAHPAAVVPPIYNSDVRSSNPLHRSRRIIGVFEHRRDAEAALTELRAAGFSMDEVSIIGKDAGGNVNTSVGGATGTDLRGNKAPDGAKAGAATGAALGGLGGLLVGLGALAIPGVGPVIAGGAVATALATAATGAGIGAAAGGITGGLVGLGIPENKARAYNDRLNRGDYIVIVDATDDEVGRAEAILKRHNIQDYDVFDATDVSSSRTRPVTGTSGVGYTNTNPSSRGRRIVGVFEHRRDAEAALTELRDAGFSMDEVSIIGKDAGGNVNTSVAGATGTDLRGNKAPDGAKAGAATGAALGGLGGLLVGLGALAIPGVGPVLLGGAAATALATAATGAGIGAAAGGITGGLVGLGIPENKARAYNDKLNRGDYIVMVDATDDEVRRAEAILKRHNIQDYDVFDATDVSSSRTRPVTGTSSVGYTNTNPSSRGRRIVGVFEHRRDAEAALTELRDAGFSMDEVSIIGKDAGGNVNTSVAGATGTDLRGNKAPDGAKAGATTGAALGGLGGLLVGLGALAIPGVGPVLLGGAAATALATAATGAGIGAAAGGITGGLVGLGIPENKARAYNDKLNRGDYIVMVDTTDDEVRRAEAILKRHNIQDYDVFDATDVSSSRTRPAIDTSRANVATTGTTSTTSTTNTTNTVDSTDADVIIIDRREEVI